MNLLLASTTLHWLGPARLPRALAKAGFTVSLLGPAAALAGHSRFLARYDTLPENANRVQWEVAFAETVERVEPRIVIPCDDTATGLMQALAYAPTPALHASTALAMAALARESLGDPQFYSSSTDKTLLPEAAAHAGVRIPPTEIVDDIEAAAAFATARGYPIVLKRGHGAAGEGVAVVAQSDGLVAAFAKVAAPQASFRGDERGRIVVQSFIPGRSVTRGSVGWDRDELGGITRERVTRNPADIGPGSTIRIYNEAEVREASRKLTRELDIRGFFTAEYIVHETGGEAYLVEINRRVGTGGHLGAAVGVDLCAALHAALSGEKVTTAGDVPPGYEKVIAQFPQEWLRDPGSAWLRNFQVDVPWDEPELFEAMLRLRHL